MTHAHVTVTLPRHPLGRLLWATVARALSRFEPEVLPPGTVPYKRFTPAAPCYGPKVLRRPVDPARATEAVSAVRRACEAATYERHRGILLELVVEAEVPLTMGVADTLVQEGAP